VPASTIVSIGPLSAARSKGQLTATEKADGGKVRSAGRPARRMIAPGWCE
jgi:hypothetical protein